MRMGQKNRMRGRNNNRRGPNPLTRSFESNGPDVKVRGTAAHIAEKYVQLARDAHSSGDVVMTESYLQHAEHYYRLIAAAQAQAQPPFAGHTAQQQAEIDIMDDEDEFEVAGSDRFTFRPPQAFLAPQNGGYGPQGQPYGDQAGGEQPAIQGDQPFVAEQPPLRHEGRGDGRQDNRPDGRQEGRYDNRQDGRQAEGRPQEGRYDNRQDGRHGEGRQQEGRYDNRQDGRQGGEGRQQDGRPDRFGNRGPFGDRRDRFRNRERRPNGDQPQQQFNAPRPPMADPASEPQPELPSFITAPVIVPPRVIAAPEPVVTYVAPEVVAAVSAEDTGIRVRRRRPRAKAEGVAGPAVEAPGEGE